VKSKCHPAIPRNVQILTARQVAIKRLNFHMSLTAVRMLAILIAMATGPALRAQSQSFEVATVKPNRSGDGSSNYPQLANGRLTAENATLKMILQAAYGVTSLQIIGPDWLNSDRFDLAAKSPEGVPDSNLMPMLQALLKDRFQLTAHRENREMPVYDLLVATGGLKISLFDPAHIPPAPPRNGAAAMIIGPMTMAQFANTLTSAAGRPVVNKTGLEGRYFCAVTFSPLAARATGTAGADGPDIFAAVQEQLGLKLEARKEPIEVLVVDRAERVPREN